MKPLRFVVNGQVVEASQGETILEACQRQGILVDSSCEGGTCGACRVIVLEKSDAMEPPEEIEAETAGDRGFLKTERLACQARPVEGLVLKTPNF